MNVSTDDASTDKETRRQGDTEKAHVPVAATAFALPVFLRPYAVTDYASVLVLWEEAKLRPYTERELERLLASGGGALVAVQVAETGSDRRVIPALRRAITENCPNSEERVEAILRDCPDSPVRRTVGEASHTGTSVPGSVVGVVLWSHNGSMGILWRLAVAEAVRGQGIATRLLDRVEQDIRDAGFGSVCLLTRSTNTIARAMYARRGYHWNEIHEFWGKKLPDDLKVSDSAETGGQTSC